MEDRNIIESIREERKQGVADGTIPEWMTSNGYLLFKQKYVLEGETVESTFRRIANAAAGHAPDSPTARDAFFDLMWKGWLALSTPVLANMGTERGCPVSCSGGYVNDSIYGFYDARLEVAMLTKNGFGTSSYLGAIRGRGEPISVGGVASGVMPVLKGFVQDSSDVSQANTRRGAWAGYLDIDHKDFFEAADYLLNHPDDLNIGWVVSKAFIARLDAGDPDAVLRWQKMMKVRCVTGKGYIFKVDHVNDQNPAMYKELGLKVSASNLCTEITLFSDEDHTFTCVLSSMNASKYDEWKETDAVYWATIFLDCVASEFIRLGRKTRGLERAVRFTERGRALGLGLLGYHTYCQDHMIPFEESRDFNEEIFSHLDSESLRASRYLAETLGEPEWCRGYGLRNTHRLAIAPNTSSALFCGGVSQGIEPIPENVYRQTGAAGELQRINPSFLQFARGRGIWSEKLRADIAANNGSVQHLEELDDLEKKVFKTAFEIDQSVIIDLASQRQEYIDQAQSINLFFDADAPEEYIAAVHQKGIQDPYIKSLYYLRSKSGIKAATSECVACEG